MGNKEIILQILLENTGTLSMYTGGGDEPDFVHFPESEDVDRESFLSDMAQKIADKLNNNTINVCIEKLKDLERPECSDHTPYRGACGGCGRHENRDVLPDLEEVIEELEKLKTLN